MISIIGEQKKVSQWPGASLRHFGMNPYNESLYRVVWSESRLHLVGGMWNDRSGTMPNDKEVKQAGKDYSISRRVAEYRWVPLYPGVKAWVLEKWLSPVAFAGTPAVWEMTMKDQESGLLALGPYPDKGEFNHCYTFPAGDPVQIETIIGMIEAGKNYSFQQKRQAHIDAEERNKAAQVQRGVDIWTEAQGPFAGNAVSGNPGKRLASDVKFKYGAEDLKMPVGDNKFFQN